MIYFLVLINAVLMSTGQILFKKAAIFINDNSQLDFFSRYAFNLNFVIGIFIFGIATFTWTKILMSMKLSIAYPLMSLSYVLTAVAAYFIFGEKISSLNLFGMLLIIAGVTFLSID